jgi:hypothetical protein
MYETFDYSHRPLSVCVGGSSSSQCMSGVGRDELPYELDAIYERERAPPVGTYEPAELDLGTVVRSPFTAKAGRNSNPLSPDGKQYMSVRQGNTKRNIGPGYYDLPDLWSPSAFRKYNRLGWEMFLAHSCSLCNAVAFADASVADSCFAAVCCCKPR